jgi:hypothetical protein
LYHGVEIIANDSNGYIGGHGCAGLYTIGALLLRLYALITLLVLIGLSFSSPISIIVMSLYLLVGICALAYVNGLLAHLQSGEEMCSWKGQVKIIVSSYICATIGPLYPVIENRNRRPGILGVAILINMLPDVVVLIISMVESGEIFSACKPGFSESYIYPFMSCHQYIAYVTAVVGLSILPGIILCRLSNQQAQTCNHSEEEPIRNGPLVPL